MRAIDGVDGRLWKSSALALLVTGVLADDTNNPPTTDHAAGFTERLDGGTNAHGNSDGCR
jgi:hypothetical protein